MSQTRIAAKTHWTRAGLAAVTIVLGVGVHDAAAQRAPLVGYWECTGTSNGISLASTFDYRADGTYVSTQHITTGGSSIEGGGGGVWQLNGDMLSDTKQRATLDRFIRNGVEVPSSDPEWQALYAQSQANVGTTTTGPIRIEGDVAYAGFYTCNRTRRAHSPN
jgi:hypothetical protein